VRDQWALVNVLRPDVLELQGLLDRDLSAWLRVDARRQVRLNHQRVPRRGAVRASRAVRDDRRAGEPPAAGAAGPAVARLGRTKPCWLEARGNRVLRSVTATPIRGAG